jgi:hypothetical protein
VVPEFVDHFGPQVAAAYDDPDDPMFAAALLAATSAFLAEQAGDRCAFVAPSAVTVAGRW